MIENVAQMPLIRQQKDRWNYQEDISEIEFQDCLKKRKYWRECFVELSGDYYFEEFQLPADRQISYIWHESEELPLKALKF